MTGLDVVIAKSLGLGDNTVTHCLLTNMPGLISDWEIGTAINEVVR